MEFAEYPVSVALSEDGIFTRIKKSIFHHLIIYTRICTFHVIWELFFFCIRIS